MTNPNRPLNVIPRKKGETLQPKYKISYSKIKEIILGEPDINTQALLAYQYGFACRGGELARVYTHKRYDSKNDAVYLCEIEGAKIRDIETKMFPPEVAFLKPNFKQHIWDKHKHIVRVPKQEVFINKDFEPWLYNIIIDWVRGKDSDECLFRFKDSAIRGRISRRLKSFDLDFSPHWLRYARGSHIADLTRDVFAVKDLLGHKRVETSLKYIGGLRSKLYDVIKPGTTFDSYLGERNE